MIELHTVHIINQILGVMDMKKINVLAKKLKEKFYLAMKRYPIALICFMLTAIMFMIVVEIDFNDSTIDQDIFIRLGMTFLYAGILTLVLKSIIERFLPKRKISWVIYLLVPVSIAVMYFVLLSDFRNSITMIRYALLSLLTASLFFYVPFIKKDKDAAYFAQKVFLRLAITLIYYGIITGGVEAIIFALEKLLSINMPEQIYAQTAIFIAGIIMPAFFVAGIPQKDDADGIYPKLVNILLIYILFILLSAYTIVLYAYFIKILIEFSLPSNLLGNLVVYYSLISIFALYFGFNLKDENKWSKLFCGIYPYTLILPVLMMLLSFIVRIREYGFTENRYYAILCIIFVLRSISIIKLQKKVKLLPLVLSFLLLISIFGPLSSFNVSKWSQNNRFEKILVENDMLDGDTIIPDENADDNVKTEISQIISYFKNTHDTKDIKLLAENFTEDDMKSVFGFDYSYGRYNSRFPLSLNVEYTNYEFIKVSGYDYIIDINSYNEQKEFPIDEGIIKLTLQQNKTESFEIELDDNVIYETDILELLMPYLKQDIRKDNMLAELVFTDENDYIAVKFNVMHAYYDEKADELDYNIKLLIKFK